MGILAAAAGGGISGSASSTSGAGGGSVGNTTQTFGGINTGTQNGWTGIILVVAIVAGLVLLLRR